MEAIADELDRLGFEFLGVEETQWPDIVRLVDEQESTLFYATDLLNVLKVLPTPVDAETLWAALEPVAVPLQPCGHAEVYIVSSGEGTSHCGACEAESVL